MVLNITAIQTKHPKHARANTFEKLKAILDNGNQPMSLQTIYSLAGQTATNNGKSLWASSCPIINRHSHGRYIVKPEFVIYNDDEPFDLTAVSDKALIDELRRRLIKGG